jgi:hypothetical protein
MKSRIMIRAFGVVIPLLLAAFAISAQTKSKTWIRGTWEGKGYQIDDQSTWTMRFTAGGGRFAIDYPSLNCGGRWKLITIDASRARFKEILNYGIDKCLNRGTVVVQRLNKRQAVYLYSDAGKREVSASAILKRTRPDKSR